MNCVDVRRVSQPETEIGRDDAADDDDAFSL